MLQEWLALHKFSAYEDTVTDFVACPTKSGTRIMVMQVIHIMCLVLLMPELFYRSMLTESANCDRSSVRPSVWPPPEASTATKW